MILRRARFIVFVAVFKAGAACLLRGLLLLQCLKQVQFGTRCTVSSVAAFGRDAVVLIIVGARPRLENMQCA